MFYAVLESGGKQYKAVEGETLEIDLLPEEVGKKKTFDHVLLLVNESETQIGSPFLSGVSVDTTVVEHFKGEKIIIFKYRPKQRYRVKTGHRQSYTRVLVDSIAFPGKSKTIKAAEQTEEKAEAPAKKRRSSGSAASAKKTTTKPAVKKTTASKSSTTKKPAKASSSKTTSTKKKTS